MTGAANKIGLGTVQFGTAYGITNTSGITPPEEISRILDLAAASGVNILDTAHLYGKSEQVLGETLPAHHSFRIVTKTPDFSKPEFSQLDRMIDGLSSAFSQSLTCLKASSLYALMVHNAGGLAGPHRRKLYEALVQLKRGGQVSRIGASVYTQADIEAILETGPIDIVQIPLNIFDQRLIQSGTLSKLKALGIEIHARSLFLQGALLAQDTPPPLGNFATYFNRYRTFLAENRVEALAACLSFGLSVPEIDRLIIGVNSCDQLAQILKTAETAPADLDFSSLACNDEALLNPAKWARSAA